MNKLPQICSKDIIKVLKKTGFYIKIKSGSHFYLKHTDGRFASISVRIVTGEKADILYLSFKKPNHTDDSKLTKDDII